MTIKSRNPLGPAGLKPSYFWGEIAPCEHLLQIYDEDAIMLDSLEGFAAGGLSSGEGVIIIATPLHQRAMEDRLWARGVDITEAQARDQYIALDAEETLSKFMVNGWPDEDLFNRTVTDLLARAGHNGRRVRAFGEMVAILWSRGSNGATVRLEHLWHKLCEQGLFSLFCAYPRSGFTQEASTSLREICDAHSKVITG